VVTSPRSLILPPGAAGLVAALEARRQGDGAPFDAWMASGFPLLFAAVHEWLDDATAAQDIVSEVLTKAFFAVGGRTKVRDELPWLATLARHARADARRERRGPSRLVPLPPSLPWDSPADARDEVAGLEVAGSVVLRTFAEAAPLLPPPYREAMCALMIDHWSRMEVLRFLMSWLQVGMEDARKILHVGRRMLAETVAGADPRKRWPRRFMKSNVDNPFQPYSPRGVLRHQGGGGSAGVLRGREVPDGPEAQGKEAERPGGPGVRPGPP
jgi:DNA-directed RNA polymerase specialized sigma24 family protein